MILIMLINVKMPTIVGILTFIIMINTISIINTISMINTTSESIKKARKKSLLFSIEVFFEQLKFHAQLSWTWKRFDNIMTRRGTDKQGPFTCEKILILWLLCMSSLLRSVIHCGYAFPWLAIMGRRHPKPCPAVPYIILPTVPLESWPRPRCHGFNRPIMGNLLRPIASIFSM